MMVDIARFPPMPKGGSVTASPKPAEPIVYVEPWKPWHGRSYQGFEQWYDWMCYDKSEQAMLSKMTAADAIRLYQIMNGIVYDIQRKNNELRP